jgi:gliding motility-associated-like protein
MIKKWNSCGIILRPFFLSVLLLAAGFVQAKVWYVDKIGNDTLNGEYPVFSSGYDGPKQTINAALSQASTGDTLSVASGTYAEHVVVSNSIVMIADYVRIAWLEVDGMSINLTLLGDTLEITDSLSLTNGYIEANPSNILFWVDFLAHVKGGSEASFVKGRVYRNTQTGTGNLDFPVGVNDDYRPVTVSFHQLVPDNRLHSIEVFKGNPPVSAALPSGIRNISRVHHWDFKRYGAGSQTDYTFEILYDSTWDDDEVFDPTGLNVLHFTGKSSWDNLQGSGNSSRKGTVQTGFSADTAGILILANKDSFMNPLGSVLPFAKFTSTGKCEDNLFAFTNQSLLMAPASIQRYEWDFGDLSLTDDTSDVKSPTYTYNTPGSYDVRLVITTDSGYTDTFTSNIQVHAVPNAYFKFTNVCLNLTSNFIDSSWVAKPDSISKYEWNFGDGYGATGKTAANNYTDPGTYNVELKVITTAGCRDSITSAVKVHSKPKAYIENANVCFGRFSRFKDTSNIIGPDTIASRLWTLGDGNTATGRIVSNTYGAAGNYNVTLKVTSQFGCQDSAKMVTTIFPKPVPSFIASNICAGEDITFTRIRSSNPPESQITYSWYQNYALKSNDTSWTLTNGVPGGQNIGLIAVSTNGCRDSAVTGIVVYSLPTPNIYLEPSIATNDSLQCLVGNKFHLRNSVKLSNGQAIASAKWHWGDGAVTNLVDSSHSYAAEGVYRVKLIITSDLGCIDSTSAFYRVRGRITPNFAKIGQCAPDSITLYDSASQSTSPILSYRWIMPSGAEYNTNPARVWNKQAGTIDVKLIATNAEGCVDSIVKTLALTQRPVVSWLISGSVPFCPGDSVTVTADGGKNMLWTSDLDTNRKKVFYNAGTYVVRASNSPACFSEDSFTVVVYPKPVVAAFTDTIVYRGGAATFRAAGAQSYTWSPALYLNKTTGSTVISTPKDSQTYTVIGTSANGCLDSAQVTVAILERPIIRIPNIITPNGDGENDYWVLSDVKGLEQFDITIMDYAGSVVYTNANYDNSWNAVKDGALLPEGIYYYHMENRLSGIIFKGFIQVIR